MNTWTPITFNELFEKLIAFENEDSDKLQNFWELIKVTPQKWQEPIYGKEGGGFWVVAICGQNIIWYNDIEEGFNLSKYIMPGNFDDYKSDQFDLKKCNPRIIQSDKIVFT